MSSFHVLIMLILSILAITSALYSANSNVVQVTDKDFKQEVLSYPGIVIVEFYAPWCGHCKSLAPEYEKAADVLKGVVKVVAVDATVSEKLASKYQIQGFPSLKVFGADKKSPVDYQGQRTADAIIAETMKMANKLVRDRKSGKTSSSSSSSSSSQKPSSKPSKSSSSSGSASEVIPLDETNFNALVLESNDHWLVEFYAPWCGHCKNLAPEWEKAAKDLKGSVKLGAVDATASTNLAQSYGVKGYPTIKLFPAGKKGKAKDYQGPREAAGIIEYALKTLEDAGVPMTISQLTKPAEYDDVCGSSGRVCALLFVPHILDSSASERNKYLETFGEAAKSLRGQPIAFAWIEAGAQPQLEQALSINQAYPGLAIMSKDKKVYAVQRLSWSLKNVKSFLSGVLSGIEKSSALAMIPEVVKTKAWDGKDAEIVSDEVPLDELFKEDL
jgi:protein disulfide-isomerase A6